MQQPGAVVSREQLTRQVLGRRLTPYDRSIDTHISNIRRKLVAVADVVSILNVRRSGYVLALADGTVTGSAAPDSRGPDSSGNAPPGDC